MATSSYITLEVPQDYIGKTIKLNSTKKLKQKLIDIGDCGYERNDAKVVPVEEITLAKRYITIRNHWDSHNLTNILPKSFPTIEDVINLISLGDCSFICSSVIAPHVCRGEGKYYEWDEVKPEQCDTFDEIPTEDFNFMYSNGKWSYTTD